MNPSIRYRQIHQNQNNINFYQNSIKVINASSMNGILNNNQAKVTNMPIYPPNLTKHKSNNIDIKYYEQQQNNVNQSHRIMSQTITNNRTISKQKNNRNQNILYKTTNGCSQLQKCSSANDFFNQIAKQQSETSKNTKTADAIPTTIEMKKVITNKNNQNIIYSSPLYTQFEQKNKINLLQIQHKKTQYQTVQIRKQIEINSTMKKSQSTSQCAKCQNNQKSYVLLMSFMRQQIQISSKQYRDRMEKIIIEQVKQIKDLRKKLINNQKCLIRLEREKSSVNYRKSQGLSPKGKDDNLNHRKDGSKISLTKSNHSVSPNHSNFNKQKLTMLSKELSPVKSINRKLSQNQTNLPISQRLASTINQNSINSSQSLGEEIVNKIKSLEQKIQITFRFEQERNQKMLKMNKRIQILQKGTLNFLSVKMERVKKNFGSYMTKSDQKINQLYKQIKTLGNKINVMNPSKQMNQMTLINSSPLINLTSTDSTGNTNFGTNPQFNINKISMKLNFFSSQMQELREISQNLKTKEFKYDNYQIQQLRSIIQQMKRKIFILQKGKFQISQKMALNEQRMEKMIEMSRYSNGNTNTRDNTVVVCNPGNINIANLNSGNNGNKKEVVYGYGNKEQQNRSRKNSSNDLNKSSKLSISYNNNSQQSTKSNNNGKVNNSNSKNLLPTSTSDKNILIFKNGASINNNDVYNNNSYSNSYNYKYTNGYPNNLNSTTNIIETNENENAYYIKSHSEFKGFTNQQKSNYSKHIDYSVYHNQKLSNKEFQYNNYQEEESFRRSSDQEQEQEEQSFDKEEEEEEDEFYHVDLSTNLNASKSYHSSSNKLMGKKNPSSHPQYPTPTINRFMEVIQYRQSKPLPIQIDQTGYLKSAQNGMYIVDRNNDGFDMNKNELEWLKVRGIVIIQH